MALPMETLRLVSWDSSAGKAINSSFSIKLVNTYLLSLWFFWNYTGLCKHVQLMHRLPSVPSSCWLARGSICCSQVVASCCGSPSFMVSKEEPSLRPCHVLFASRPKASQLPLKHSGTCSALTYVQPASWGELTSHVARLWPMREGSQWLISLFILLLGLAV